MWSLAFLGQLLGGQWGLAVGLVGSAALLYATYRRGLQAGYSLGAQAGGQDLAALEVAQATALPPPPLSGPAAAANAESEPEPTSEIKHQTGTVALGGHGPSGALAPASQASEALLDDRALYVEFVRLRHSCGEMGELNYDLFVERLEAARATVLSTHRWKAVAFTAYVKNGRAALRATPR